MGKCVRKVTPQETLIFTALSSPHPHLWPDRKGMKGFDVSSMAVYKLLGLLHCYMDYPLFHCAKQFWRDWHTVVAKVPPLNLPDDAIYKG
jgi:hypothetical protein